MYGEHLTRPVILGIVETEQLEAHKDQNRKGGWNLPYVSFEIEYTISVLGGPRERWERMLSVYCDDDAASAQGSSPRALSQFLWNDLPNFLQM